LWKKAYAALEELTISSPMLEEFRSSKNMPSDPTAKWGIARAYYSGKMDMVKKAAASADEDLYIYILKAVTEDLSYNYLKTRLGMPCSKDMYYDRYRKFFWLLSKERL
jgi:hypothetical protein